MEPRKEIEAIVCKIVLKCQDCQDLKLRFSISNNKHRKTDVSLNILIYIARIWNLDFLDINDKHKKTVDFIKSLDFM